MRAYRLGWPGVCSLIALLASLEAGAVERPSEACLTCHANRGLARDGGGSLFVDVERLHASAHARMACTTCHTDATSIPHAARLVAPRCVSCHAAVADTLSRSAHSALPGEAKAAPTSRGATGAACLGCHGGGGAHDVRAAAQMGRTTCATCHKTESADFRSSVHGVALANGDNEAATCRSCHGSAHAMASHLDPNASTHRAHLAATCAHCHADRELVTRRQITIPEAYELYANSVHGRSKNPRAATCNDCHESHRLKRNTDPASSIFRANIAATCGQCHPRESHDYAGSVHGAALARGVSQAPTCTDCHGEHMIRGPRDKGSPVMASAVTKTCAHCHEAEGIRETFGLPAGRLNTYQDSFHGLAARGGSPVVANCASCHGAHDILPSSDPRSAVSRHRLSQTCGKCHPGAGTKFALGAVHVAMATPSQPVLYVVRWIYLLLIAGTIGGMAFHNGLDFASKIQRHWLSHLGRAEAIHASAGRWFVRMTGVERAQHVLLAASFFTLVYTGFALKFPEGWPFAWLARLEGGYAWRSIIHRAAALAMVAVSLAHVGYLFTARGRSTLAAMVPSVRDLGDVWLNLLYMLGRRNEPPAFDRFGYIEKAEYWALIWGTLVMTATGLVLWFENLSLQFLSKWMLDLATIVHYYEAWLAFLAIVVWHLYQNIVNPDVYPMNWSWITGRIDEQQLRHEHRAEWERIAAKESAEATSDPEDVEP